MGTLVEIREGAHALAAQLRKEGNLTLEECRVMLRAVRAHKKALETVEKYLVGGSCRVAGLERLVSPLPYSLGELVGTAAVLKRWR